MNKISLYIDDRTRMYRKARGLTPQQLADMIHKSRTSVSKYENGEITLDVETLCGVTRMPVASLEQLMDIQPALPRTVETVLHIPAKSPFFQVKRLYFYFYNGRYRCLKDGIIDIYERENASGNYEATLFISVVIPAGKSSEVYYTGKVVYSGMPIRLFSINQRNVLEGDLLYIFSPLEIRDPTVRLLCGISSADLMPCAFKCLVTLTPQEHTENFKQQPLITKKELQKR